MKELILITGASGGIGKDLAITLAEAGEEVLAVARRIEELQELQAIFPNKINVINAAT